MTLESSPSSSAALLTGASSGIGRELASLFAADGHDLVLVARRGYILRDIASDLSERYQIATQVVAADLAQPESIETIANEVADLDVEITHLVNNAGFGIYGPYLETNGDIERDMIEVNVTALSQLTKTFLPEMVARGSGRILNVASGAAFQPGPGMAVYYATKAYVLHFSVALAIELEGTGVSVTTLCPGPTRTGFAEEAGMEDSKLFVGGRGMDAARAAEIGYRGMQRGKRVVVPGAGNTLLALIAKVTPRGLAARIAARVQAPR